MEHLMWFGINSEESTINLHSVDTMSILPFLRGRDFQIVEMLGYKDDIEKNLLREDEEIFWVRKNHYIEISALIEEDDFENISSLFIHFENGDGLNYCFGQLSVRLSDKVKLKELSLKLLEQYGYFASEVIWEFVSRQEYDMPINYVLGMEEKDLGDSLERMRERGISIAKEYHTNI